MRSTQNIFLSRHRRTLDSGAHASLNWHGSATNISHS
jgi:hypothetical protein